MHYEARPSTFRNAKELRQSETHTETLLWSHLRKRQLGVKFRRQHPLGDYIADFYCHPARLVVEIDGHYHQEKAQKEFDSSRDEAMNQLGIQVLRFSDERVKEDIEAVIEEIKKCL